MTIRSPRRHLLPVIARRPIKPRVPRSSPSPQSRSFLTFRTPSSSSLPSTQQVRSMAHPTVIRTSEACPPAGPYSQGIKAAGQVFVSGQIPADAQGNIVQGDIGTQTEACIANVAAILRAAGSDMAKVVKVNVFLVDMADFAGMNAVYEKHFVLRPARSCVAVKQLPKGVPVEIECIALQ